jgi:hypothetical protein
MTGLEVAAFQVDQEWRIRLAAAEELLELIDEKIATAQALVDSSAIISGGS